MLHWAGRQEHLRLKFGSMHLWRMVSGATLRPWMNGLQFLHVGSTK